MLIKINSNTVIQFNLFTNQSCLEDLNEDECVQCFKDDTRSHEDGAKLLINALQDHWTPLFLISLVKEANKKLLEHDTKYKTNFAINKR